MKKSKKKPQLSSEQNPHKIDNKKRFLQITGSVVLAIAFIFLGWFLGHQGRSYDPYHDLDNGKYTKHEFLVKSAEVSVKMAHRALEALRNKNIKEAIEDCRIAIDIFPIDAKPYILLTKLYLMTGQEQNLYDTLTLAGRSYPNFDNIVATIDDKNLDNIPLEESPDNVFLANFPENKRMAISYMFDDGEADVYKALPAFEKYGWRATIPVIPGFVPDKTDGSFWGSWEQWKDAAARGFEIANHSMYHHDARDLHGSDFDLAIDQAKVMIEKNIGHKVTAYVFPHDSYTDEAIRRALRLHKFIRAQEYLRNYYKRSVEIVFGGPHVSIGTANRIIDIGIKRRLWIVAKCHGITPKVSMRSFKSITPAFLDSNLAYIHSKSDDVWVDTFSNVFEYLFTRTHTSIDTKTLTAGSVDFELRNDNLKEKLSMPLTVVIKEPQGVSVKSANGSDGHVLKAWSCDSDKICVDVDSYNENIHVSLLPSKNT